MKMLNLPFEDVLNILLYTMSNRLVFDRHHAASNEKEKFIIESNNIYF